MLWCFRVFSTGVIIAKNDPGKKDKWVVLGEKRTKTFRGRWEACAAGGCRDVENLDLPKPLRTGTGAIR